MFSKSSSVDVLYDGEGSQCVKGVNPIYGDNNLDLQYLKNTPVYERVNMHVKDQFVRDINRLETRAFSRTLIYSLNMISLFKMKVCACVSSTLKYLS